MNEARGGGELATPHGELEGGLKRCLGVNLLHIGSTWHLRFGMERLFESTVWHGGCTGWVIVRDLRPTESSTDSMDQQNSVASA